MALSVITKRTYILKKPVLTMQVSSQKRILEEIMPLRIIREVEKWPVIYTKDNHDMTNPHFKYKVWEEVAKNLFVNYQIYSAAEKQAKVTSLMKKWRNLRDTFKRQLMVEKKNREGHNIKKKQYVYFKHMSFLLPHMAEDETPNSAAMLCDATRTSRRRHSARPASAAVTLPAAATADVEHIDEDKHFLLSLLPSFRRMNEDEKLNAKIGILKVIKDIKNSSIGLDTLAVDVVTNTIELADELAGGDDDVVKKEELENGELMDNKSPSDSNSDDTE